MLASHCSSFGRRSFITDWSGGFFGSFAFMSFFACSFSRLFVLLAKFLITRLYTYSYSYFDILHMLLPGSSPPSRRPHSCALVSLILTGEIMLWRWSWSSFASFSQPRVVGSHYLLSDRPPTLTNYADANKRVDAYWTHNSAFGD